MTDSLIDNYLLSFITFASFWQLLMLPFLSKLFSHVPSPSSFYLFSFSFLIPLTFFFLFQLPLSFVLLLMVQLVKEMLLVAQVIHIYNPLSTLVQYFSLTYSQLCYASPLLTLRHQRILIHFKMILLQMRTNHFHLMMNFLIHHYFHRYRKMMMILMMNFLLLIQIPSISYYQQLNPYLNHPFYHYEFFFYLTETLHLYL